MRWGKDRKKLGVWAGIVALPEYDLCGGAVNYAGNGGVLEVEWMDGRGRNRSVFVSIRLETGI